MAVTLTRYRPRHRAAKVRDESSNSFAMFVALLPVILGSFGMGIDISRNVFIRTSLQNSLDMAVVAGAGVTKVGEGGYVEIDREKVIPTIEHTYALNRAAGPALDCRERYVIADSNQVRCWRLLPNHIVVEPNYIEYGINERSRNAFLQVVGLAHQEYRLISEARVNQDTE